MDLSLICVGLLLLAGAGFVGTLATGTALALGLKGVQKDLALLSFVGATHLLVGALVGGMWLIG
jgi:hypothetical protein